MFNNNYYFIMSELRALTVATFKEETGQVGLNLMTRAIVLV